MYFCLKAPPITILFSWRSLLSQGGDGEFNTHLPAGGLNNCLLKQHWAFGMRPPLAQCLPTPSTNQYCSNYRGEKHV